MLTKRDRKIINYLTIYKYITLSQLEKIFFREQGYSYNIARRRMKQIMDMGYCYSHKMKGGNKIVYILKDESSRKINPPSEHRLIVLDVLAELYNQGYEVQSFEVEKIWQNGKIRSDGYFEFIINDRLYRFFLEVQISNNKHNLEKYSKLYETGEVQYYNKSDHYPNVLLVTDKQYNDLDTIENVNVITLPLNLECFSKILVGN